jgi:hypothetical protein
MAIGDNAADRVTNTLAPHAGAVMATVEAELLYVGEQSTGLARPKGGAKGLTSLRLGAVSPSERGIPARYSW